MGEVTYISGLNHDLNLDELIDYVKEGELDIEVNEPHSMVLNQEESMKFVNEIERLRKLVKGDKNVKRMD